MCRNDITATFRIPFTGKDLNNYMYEQEQMMNAVSSFNSKEEKYLPLCILVGDKRYSFGSVSSLSIDGEVLVVECSIQQGGTVVLVKKEDDSFTDIDIRAISVVASSMELVFPFLNNN